MEMKFRNNVLPTIRNHYEKWEVWVLMENYNVWHKDCETTSFGMALKLAESLENKCKCFTEIKHKTEEVVTYRRYAYIKE